MPTNASSQQTPHGATARTRLAIEVRELASSVRGLLADLDPTEVPLTAAPDLWRAFTELRKLAAAGETLLTARAAAANEWKHAGHANAAEWLAHNTGTSVGAARTDLNTSQRLEQLPATTDALKTGALSPQQADAIADAATTNPNAEHDLIDLAQRESLRRTREEAARRKAEIDNERTKRDREARIRRQRSCRSWTTPDGTGHLRANGPAEHIADIARELEHQLTRHLTNNPTNTNPADTSSGRGRGGSGGGDRNRRCNDDNRQPPNDTPDNLRFDILHHLITEGPDPHDHPDHNPPDHTPNDDNDDDDNRPNTGDDHRRDDDVCDDRDSDGDGHGGDDDVRDSTGDSDSTGDAGRSTRNQEPRVTDRNSTKPKRPRPSHATRPGQRLGIHNLALLRIDLTALTRGHTETGEVCELVGHTNISVDKARQLLGDALWTIVLTQAERVAGVVNLARTPTIAQQLALLWEQPHCSVAGCNRTIRLETDHTIDWATSLRTITDQLDRLCDHHHWLKTHSGWALAAPPNPPPHHSIGTPRQPMVPPDHPDHPTNRTRTATAKPAAGEPAAAKPAAPGPAAAGPAAPATSTAASAGDRGDREPTQTDQASLLGP